MSNYTNSLSSFDTSGVLANVTAHNLANISTEGYLPHRMDSQTGPGNQGVQVGAIYPDPGPAIITHFFEREPHIGLEQTAEGMHNAAVAYTDSRSYEYGLMGQADSYAAWRVQEHQHFIDAHNVTFAEGSNTNLPLELANLAHAQTAFTTNAAVVRTLDTMTGSLLNAVL